MHTLLKQGLAAARRVHSLFIANPANFVIIVYHFVTAQHSPFTKNGHNVKPHVFRQQLELLKTHFSLIDLRKLQKLPTYHTDTYKPLAAVCFDDNYACVFDEAYPILEEVGVPATVFINSSVVGNQGLLWRDKARYLVSEGLEGEFVSFLKDRRGLSYYDFSRLDERGFYKWSKDALSIRNWSNFAEDMEEFFSQKGLDGRELAQYFNLYGSLEHVRELPYLSFGNHTHRHPLMTMLSPDEQMEEISKCRMFLDEQRVCDVGLALPFAPYNGDTLKVCRKLNYEFLFTAHGHGNDVLSPTNTTPLVFDRIFAPDSFGQFTVLLKR